MEYKRTFLSGRIKGRNIPPVRAYHKNRRGKNPTNKQPLPPPLHTHTQATTTKERKKEKRKTKQYKTRQQQPTIKPPTTLKTEQKPFETREGKTKRKAVVTKRTTYSNKS